VAELKASTNEKYGIQAEFHLQLWDKEFLDWVDNITKFNGMVAHRGHRNSELQT